MDNQEQQNGEEAPKLRIKRDPGVAEDTKKQCPKCGTEMPDDAVLCVQCGYDLRSGSVHKAASGLSHTVLVIATVVAGVLIAAVSILILIKVFSGSDETVPVVAAPAEPEPAAVEAPVEPVPEEPEPLEVMPHAEEDSVEQAAPVDEQDEEPVDIDETPEAAATDEPEEEEAVEEVDRAAQREEMRHSLRVSLDDRIPMLAIGDEVELRRNNGFVHRGELVAIRDGMALVVDGEIRERVPLNELDRASRLQVDTEFRERLVESRLRAMIENGP